MGLFSWFRRSGNEPSQPQAQAPKASEEAVPVPSSWPAHSRSVRLVADSSVAAATAETAETVQTVQTVRRFFASLAAANSQVFDRALAGQWEQLSVERYFMSITGPRPTLNRGGQVCSETIGTIDDAFASFQWD
jgi:hypothetical protein